MPSDSFKYGFQGLMTLLNPANAIASQAGYQIGKSLFLPDPPESSASSVSSDYLSNNDFMTYLEGLLASQGQENVENRLFNMNEAQKHRDWQEYMSNTSYQRAVADLQKAGLNPILAYQQGGATTPSGGSASYNVGGGDTLSSILNSFANLISSASDLASIVVPLSAKSTRKIGF